MDGDYLKGDTVLGFGVSGHVELSPSGYAVKSAWRNEEANGCADLIHEAKIYEALGKHDRLLAFEGWDSEECALTLEYAQNGCLNDYLLKNQSEILPQQRKQWAKDCAEGLAFLHAANVIHFDFKPANLLLDADLRIKVIDFGGASLLGSTPLAYAPTRYSPRGSSPEDIWPLGIQVDLFALGSIIYKIWTGEDPFPKLESDEVTRRFCCSEHPDVRNLPHGELIRRCWTGGFSSAEEVKQALETS